MAKLGDICTLINGYAFKPGDWADEGLPIIRIQNLNDKNAPFNYYNGTIDEKYIVNDHDLLFAWSGTPGTSFGAFFWNRGKGILNQHIFNVFPVDSVNKNYFRYALNGNLAKIISKAHGGVGLQHITKKELEAIEIPVLPISEQLHIAATLDGVTRVIDLCNAFLEKLDLLVKARFVEMFGEPVSNPMGWKQITLFEALAEGRTVTYGIVQTGDEVEDGVPVFRPIDITGGHIPRRYELKKTDPQISNQYKRTLLKGNELLVTVRGSIGETFQTTPEFEGCNVGRNIVPIVTDPNRIIQRFLQELFAQEGIKNWLKRITKGIALQGLNMGEFKEMPVIMPPIEKQQEFTKFVVQTDQTKSAVRKVLEKAETLKKALMQEYFGP